MSTLQSNKVRVLQHLLELLDAEPWLLTAHERSLVGQVVLAQEHAPYHRYLPGSLSRGLTYTCHTQGRPSTYRYDELSPREQVIADLAAQVDSNHTEDKLTRVNYGAQPALREEEVLEIAEIAALFNYTNRINRVLGFVPAQLPVQQPSSRIVPDPLPYFYEGA